MNQFAWLSLLCLTSFEALAESENCWLDNLLDKLGASETVDHTKMIDWGVLPGPFVNPDV